MFWNQIGGHRTHIMNRDDHDGLAGEIHFDVLLMTFRNCVALGRNSTSYASRTRVTLGAHK